MSEDYNSREFRTNSLNFRQAVKDESSKNFVSFIAVAEDLFIAHEQLVSGIINLLNRVSGQPFEKQPLHVEGQLGLLAQFIQGIRLCADAITGGQYAQAAALLKQEMETIEAVREYDSGHRKDRVTPRIRHFSGFGREYGWFNQFAHSSVKDIIHDLVQKQEGEVSSPSILPQFNKEIAIRFYGLHVLFVLNALLCQAQVVERTLGESLTDEEQAAIGFAGKILIEQDIVALRDSDDT